MLKTVEQHAKARMDKTIKSLEEVFSHQRVGRAHPGLVEDVLVDYHGTPTHLSQMASIVVKGALMLEVSPWEKKLIPQIEKAIHAAGLGLNPVNTGDIIRIPLPPLSEERRKEFIKKIKTEAEDAKVSIRNIRRDALQTVKDHLKKKEVSEDDSKRAEDHMQKLTDGFIQQIDKLTAAKEKELLTV